MVQNFIKNNKKTSIFLLAGVAAFAYYKYSKMNPLEKERIRATIKEKGGELLRQMVPLGLGKYFAGAQDKTTNPLTGASI